MKILIEGRMASTTPSQSTPLRGSICQQQSSSPTDSIVVDTTPRPSRAFRVAENTTNTSPETSRTPLNQKRPRSDYKSLHNYGFQGPPSTLPNTSAPTKKARLYAPEKKQNHVKESATFIIEDTQEHEEEQEIEKRKPNATGKRAWW
jgi:hypothetical protein